MKACHVLDHGITAKQKLMVVAVLHSTVVIFWCVRAALLYSHSVQSLKFTVTGESHSSVSQSSSCPAPCPGLAHGHACQNGHHKQDAIPLYRSSHIQETEQLGSLTKVRKARRKSESQHGNASSSPRTR